MRLLLSQLPQVKSLLKNLILSTILIVLITIGCLIDSAAATSVLDIPDLSDKAWVVDEAGAISFSNESSLTNKLKKLAENTGQELRMVVINRLDYDETIDTFADKLFTRWFPTPEEQTNETLLVLDTLSNDVAIRSGANVKDLLTEEISQSVATETIAVPLRQGNKYNQALLAASDRLIQVLSGQEDPGPPIVAAIETEGTFTKAEDTDAGNATIWVVVLLLLATIIPMVTYFWYVGFPGN